MYRQQTERRLNAPALLLLLGAAALLTTQQAQAQESSNNNSQRPQVVPIPEQAGHLRLVDDLDRPQDGYCLDLVGSGNHVRFDMPLTAHNCKPGLYHDEAVILEPSGHIRFPTYGACATVAGLNGKVLPHTAVMPRGCGERSAFLEADRLQRFTLHADGRVELTGSGLCLSVGDRSDSTFDDTHRWRALFMAECDKAEPKLSRWRFTDPRKP